MNTNILGQEMAFEATKVPRKFIDDQLIIWEERRNILYNGLKELGFDLWNPEGAFYMIPKVDNALDFVWDLYKDYNVITYLGDWFGLLTMYAFHRHWMWKKLNEGSQKLRIT